MCDELVALLHKGNLELLVVQVALALFFIFWIGEGEGVVMWQVYI